MQTSDSNSISIQVKDLNRHLGCLLCNGYFRDARTITACLHTFCFSCLKGEFSRTATKDKKCPYPQCTTTLGQNPFEGTKILLDPTLQGIVDHLFPIFPSSKRQKTEESKSSKQRIRVIPHPSTDPHLVLPPLSKPLLEVNKDIEISKIRKFIYKRLSESMSISADQIVIMADSRVLRSDESVNTALQLHSKLISSEEAVTIYYMLSAASVASSAERRSETN